MLTVLYVVSATFAADCTYYSKGFVYDCTLDLVVVSCSSIADVYIRHMYIACKYEILYI